MKFLVSSGEVSGDVAGAHVARTLLRMKPDAQLFGLGGSRLAEAGVSVDFHTNHLGTIGVSESFRVIPELASVFAGIRERLEDGLPDAALLIGNDIFNVILGRWLRAQGVPVVVWFPPQIWIWQKIARFFAPSYDLVLASFPDEAAVYRNAGVRTEFVGHYLADVLEPVTEPSRAAARRTLALPSDATVVGILPGSRLYEIRPLAPIFLHAARTLLREGRDIRFVLPLSDRCFADEIASIVARCGVRDRVTIVDDSHAAMRASDLLLVASGTATLEAALLGVPMLIGYRVSPVTWAIVSFCISAGLIGGYSVGLPNLVAGRPVAPEFRQDELSPPAVARAAAKLLDDPAALAQRRRDLACVRTALATSGTASRVAAALLREASRSRVAAMPRIAPDLLAGESEAS